jgi:hypothetical protein
MPRPSASDKGGSRTPIDRLAATIGSNLVPLGRGFSYFSAVPLGDDDLREYLNEPIAALPPAVCEIVAPVRIVIAPYLEREDPDGIPRVAFDPPPPEKRLRSAFLLDNDSTLFFATRDETPSDYHQAFFNTLAHLLSRRAEKATLTKYSELLVAEIEHHVHGEVDEPSWERKRNLPPASGGDKPNTKSKAFRDAQPLAAETAGSAVPDVRASAGTPRAAGTPDAARVADLRVGRATKQEDRKPVDSC